MCDTTALIRTWVVWRPGCGLCVRSRGGIPEVDAPFVFGFGACACSSTFSRGKSYSGNGAATGGCAFFFASCRPPCSEAPRFRWLRCIQTGFWQGLSALSHARRTGGRIFTSLTSRSSIRVGRAGGHRLSPPCCTVQDFSDRGACAPRSVSARTCVVGTKRLRPVAIRRSQDNGRRVGGG